MSLLPTFPKKAETMEEYKAEVRGKLKERKERRGKRKERESGCRAGSCKCRDRSSGTDGRSAGKTDGLMILHAASCSRA